MAMPKQRCGIPTSSNTHFAISTIRSDGVKRGTTTIEQFKHANKNAHIQATVSSVCKRWAQYNMELYYMLTYYNIVRHTQQVAHIYRLPTRPLSMFVYVCAHELAILFFSLSFIVLYIWRNLRELYWAQIEHGNRSSDSEMVYHQGQPYTIVRCTLRTYINADDAQMLWG